MGKMKLFELSRFDVTLYDVLCRVMDKYDDYEDNLKEHPDGWPEPVKGLAKSIKYLGELIEEAADKSSNKGARKAELRNNLAALAAMCIRTLFNMNEERENKRIEEIKTAIIREGEYQRIDMTNVFNRYSKDRLVRIINKLTEEFYEVGTFSSNEKIAEYIVHYFYIEENMPTCKKDCRYRKNPEQLPLQRNALRVEIMTPSPRCAAKLRFGAHGGDFWDYHECTHAANL